MNDNLNDAPILTQKDIMTNNIRKECKKTLEKYFEDREYNENKIKVWKNYALEEINNYLKSNYNNFGFIILILVYKRGGCRTNSFSIDRNDSDNYCVESIITNTIYCEIRIFFTKIYNVTTNHIENVEEEILLKMNKILTNQLINKKYLGEIAEKDASEIVKNLNTFLLQRKGDDQRPCSYHTCYILQEPFNF